MAEISREEFEKKMGITPLIVGIVVLIIIISAAILGIYLLLQL